MVALCPSYSLRSDEALKCVGAARGTAFERIIFQKQYDPTRSVFIIQNCIVQSEFIMIVYNELSTVERELGISAKTLYSVSNSISKHYRAVSIPKRDGSFRHLSVPDERLKAIQRAIAEKLLVREPVSTYATAYRIAVGINRNAIPHVGKPKILKLDIKGFFDSITYSLVKERAFPKGKYSEQIRVLLAMLCYYGESLPQGAPSSPIISNIIMCGFDEYVGIWCKERGIAYTRYCDDMTFSGEFKHKEVIRLVADELRKLGLFLNEKKTVVVDRSERQIVTGVLVNEKVNVTAEYRRRIKQEVYYCSKFGVEDHLLRNNINTAPEKYLLGLLGRINYVLQIRPDDKPFAEYRESIKALMRQYK